MLRCLRLILLVLFIILSSVVIVLMCLVRPRHSQNAHHGIMLYASCCKILGVKVIIRGKEHLTRPSIYLANHQSNWDIFIACKGVPEHTVTMGKKSLLYLPIFGQLYWLTGNLLVDRESPRKAATMLKKIEAHIKKKRISIWIFPEGTRNLGKGLKAFKSGAFRLAMKAQVPVIPVCVSEYYHHFDLNRWDNGVVILEYLPPIQLPPRLNQQAMQEAIDDVKETMQTHIEHLTQEALALGAQE